MTKTMIIKIVMRIEDEDDDEEDDCMVDDDLHGMELVKADEDEEINSNLEEHDCQ